MSRVIKFRAWIQSKRRMYAVESLSPLPSCVQIDLAGVEDAYTFPYDSKDLVLMQYVGWQDKHGTEVYEGDIVKANLVEYTAQFTEVVEEVKIIENGLLLPFWMRVNYGEDWWHDCLADGFEIVGNIHEQPDLLAQ